METAFKSTAKYLKEESENLWSLSFIYMNKHLEEVEEKEQWIIYLH